MRRLVKLLTNEPEPVPVAMQASPRAGLPIVFQQIPLWVTGAPPWSVMFPPEVAVVLVIFVISFVVRSGTRVARVVKVNPFP